MSAFYAGMDVSDLTTAICVIDAKGLPIFEGSVETKPKSIQTALKPYRKMLKAVAQESGSKASWLHKELSKARFPVVCIDARLAAANLANLRNKTDKNDARAIAQIVRTGWFAPAYVKSDEAFRMRLLLTHRKTIMRSATRIQITLRMSLKLFGALLIGRKGKLSVDWGGRTPDSQVLLITRTMLRARDMLRTEVDQIDRSIEKIASKDRVCRRFMTVPGVGPLTAMAFRWGVDDPDRFKSSRSVASHFGLTPRRRQSGQYDYSGRISKMGDVSVRTALYEAAAAMLNVSRSQCALRQWGLRLKEIRGNRYACVAVARKLAVILHRMWITGRDFDPRAQL